MSGLTGVLVIATVVLLLSSCGSSGGGGEGKVAVVSSTTTRSTVATSTLSTVPVAIDEFSTFKSKDPFRQQNLPVTSTTAGSGGTTTTGSGGTTTTAGTGSTTTTTGGGTTATTHPSDVTTPIHSLKILSIDEVNGEPVVTFEVDGVIYEDKQVGDVVSTSWGQIEVVDIDADAQTVTFLHGSETRTLTVGEEFLK